MLYDNGSTTQQLSINEKNAKDSKELSDLKESARMANEAKERENIAVQSRALGEESLMNKIENRLAQNYQIQEQQMRDREAGFNNQPVSNSTFAQENRAGVSQNLGQAIKSKMQSAGNSLGGLFDYFTEDSRASEKDLRMQELADNQLLEQEDYDRNQNFESIKRLDSIFGPDAELSEIEMNNAKVLMESDKNWSDKEIRDMALNNKRNN